MTIEFIYYLTNQLSSKNYKEVIKLLGFSEKDIKRLETFVRKDTSSKYK
jgi:hypothetical protein